MDARHRILIADDKAVMHEALEAFLLPEGYELAFASTGPEALTKAMELTPDVILVEGGLDAHLGAVQVTQGVVWFVWHSNASTQSVG